MIPFPKLLKNIWIYLLLAIASGIAVGIFFGPRTQNLFPLEKAIDMFWQAVIILYIPISLLQGLGALQPKETGRLLFKAISFLLLLWVITIAACFFARLFLPPVQPTVLDLSPHSQKLFESLLQYVIPLKPLSDIASNVLPPLAFFSLLLGIAFMHEKTKEPLLSLLQEGTDILEKLLVWLVIISPFKALLHYAVIAGTLDLSSLSPISFYIVFMIGTCLFFSLFFLPMLVSLLTPLSYREMVRRFAFVGLASFGTGQPLIAFPFIAESLRKIRLEYHFPLLDWQATYRMIVPLAFSFAQLGNILSLFFVFFFAFFFHAALDFSQIFILPFFAVILSIGSPSSSVENLMVLIKEMHFPEQAVNYLGQIQHLVVNFKVLMSSTAVLCLTIIVMMLHERKVRKGGMQLALFFVVSIAALGGFFFTTRFFFPPRDAYDAFIKTKNLTEAIGPLPQMRMESYPQESQKNVFIPPQKGSILNRVLVQKTLRVGFYPDIPPYCYANSRGELMGFDIAFMAQLASELEVSLELIPLRIERMEEDLNNGVYDIAIGDIHRNSTRLLDISFSTFYQENHNVLLALRTDSRNYRNLAGIGEMESVRIGAAGALGLIAKEHFPEAEVIETAVWQDLLNHRIDLFFTDNIPGRIRSLEQSKIVSLDFGDLLGKVYVSYALPKLDTFWKSFINEWLSLQKLSGFYQKQYDYWILEEPLKSKEVRWNLLDALKE